MNETTEPKVQSHLNQRAGSMNRMPGRHFNVRERVYPGLVITANLVKMPNFGDQFEPLGHY